MLPNDQLLALVKNFPDPLIAADLDRRITRVNDAFTKQFGYTEDEVLGKTTLFLYNRPEDFYRTSKTRFNVDAQINNDPYVIEYRRKDGTTFIGETTGVPILDSTHEKIGFIGVIRDITARRRFDEAVYKFQNLTYSNEYAVDYKIDKALQITCEYYGMAYGILSHIEGNTYTVRNCYAPDGTIKPGDTYPLEETYSLAVYNSNEITAYDNVANSKLSKHPCYDKFKLNAYIGSCIYAAGERYGTLNFTSPQKRDTPFTKHDHDICRVAANWMSFALTKEIYNSELIRARKKAEESNKAKTHFIANISHEVRTPLNGIMGYADILANMIDDPDIRKLSGNIHDSAHALLDILNDVIDISKIEHGEFKIIRSSYNPKKIIQDTVDLFSINARDKENEMLIRLDPSLPEEVIGDGARLKQVLSNVVSNATKFTNKGQIRVSALYDTDKQQMRCQVSDTGIGIPDDMKEKVFDDYIQADTGIRKTYGGTGLGLSISKKLIEMMHGKITLDSKLGLGTTLTISIPASPADSELDTEQIREVTPKQKPESKKTKTHPPKILLVEDIPMNVEIAEAMLYRAKCSTDTAMNGLQALEKVKEKEYDLIFLDIQMPDIDGITVAREIRKLGINTPIIALTAHIMQHEVVEFMESGMNDYLPKPIIYDDLRKALSSWVG